MLDFGYVEKAQTLFDDRMMVITTMGQGRFFDLETARLLGTAIDLPSFMEGSSYFNDTTAYAIDESHILVSYKLNPVLGMPAKSLAEEACHRWGARSQMTLTAHEAATAEARFRADPCI